MFSKNEIATAPFLPIALCFSLGIVLCVLSNGNWAICLAIFITAVLCKFFNGYFTSLLLTTLLGFCNASISIPNETDNSICGQSYLFNAQVTNYKEGSGSRILTIKLLEAGNNIDSLQPIPQCNAQLVIPGFTPIFAKGENITFKACFEPIEQRTDLPDEITSAHLNARKNILISAQITDNDVIEQHSPTGFIGWCLQQHDRIIETISTAQLSTSSKELLIAIIGGDSNVLDNDLRNSFSLSGLAHILALSGLHVGIIVMIASALFLPLHLFCNGNLKIAAVIISIWLFAFISGLSPSVIRASIMGSIYLLGKMLYRRTSALNSLAVAATIILIFAPESIFQVGFQLSFAAVLSIIVFAERLNPFNRQQRLAFLFGSYISVTTCAMLGTAMLSAIYFHSFPIYFLLANCAASLLITPIVTGGVALILFNWIGFDSALITWLIDKMCSLLVFIADFFSKLPGASYGNFYFEPWTIIPMLLFLTALKVILDGKSRMRIAFFIFSSTALIVTLAISKPIKPEHRIYMLRNTYHTELAYTEGDSLLRLISTTPIEKCAVEEITQVRFSEFLSRRGLSKVKLDTTCLHHDRCVTIGDTSIGLLSGKRESLPAQKLSYAAICRGFKGNIKQVITKYSPDTVLLAYDLHPRRAMHYREQCDTLGVPYIWLRERPWALTYDNSLTPRVK